MKTAVTVGEMLAGDGRCDQGAAGLPDGAAEAAGAAGADGLGNGVGEATGGWAGIDPKPSG